MLPTQCFWQPSLLNTERDRPPNHSTHLRSSIHHTDAAHRDMRAADIFASHPKVLDGS